MICRARTGQCSCLVVDHEGADAIKRSRAGNKVSKLYVIEWQCRQRSGRGGGEAITGLGSSGLYQSSLCNVIETGSVEDSGGVISRVGSLLLPPPPAPPPPPPLPLCCDKVAKVDLALRSRRASTPSHDVSLSRHSLAAANPVRTTWTCKCSSVQLSRIRRLGEHTNRARVLGRGSYLTGSIGPCCVSSPRGRG